MPPGRRVDSVESGEDTDLEAVGTRQAACFKLAGDSAPHHSLGIQTKPRSKRFGIVEIFLIQAREGLEWRFHGD
jgi:hypothetical protein